jgi:hypothetical protein
VSLPSRSYRRHRANGFRRLVVDAARFARYAPRVSRQPEAAQSLVRQVASLVDPRSFEDVGDHRVDLIFPFMYQSTIFQHIGGTAHFLPPEFSAWMWASVGEARLEIALVLPSRDGTLDARELNSTAEKRYCSRI